MNKNRPSWDEYFMDMADFVSKRSTCLRRKVGAVLVRNHRILATGYNGAPRNLSHCIDGRGCLREKKKIPSGTRHELCRALHAEMNVVVQAALHGVSTKDSTLYCTFRPCGMCAKLLVNAGVKKIVYKESYPDEMAEDILEEAGIELVKYAEIK